MRTNWIILTLFAFFIHTAEATPFQVQEYKLDNGMKILVKTDHRAPVATVYTWYNVGGSYEPNGITGISHALEHMMFQGTSAYPAGKYFQLIQQNGGVDNAVTSSDYTFYEVHISKDKLPLIFQLEADRMRNLSLDEKAFAKEIEVVKEERRSRTENNPRAYTFERFAATAFPGSPYQNPVLGWPGDLHNMTASDLRRWYETWYVPNNAFVVVVGDVDPDSVYQLAQTYFGTLKSSPLPIVKPFQALKPVGERFVEVKRPANVPHLIMGYDIPTIANPEQDSERWEPYALEVLSGILDGGKSARFSQYLVREQKIASSVGASADIYDRLPSLFTFSGTPTDEHTLDELQQAIQQQIQDLQTNLVSNQELNRVKTQILADKTYQQDSISSQARVIGLLESLNLSWEEYNNYFDQVNAVTPEQIQKVAQKYFVPDRLTVAVLVPQPMTGAN